MNEQEYKFVHKVDEKMYPTTGTMLRQYIAEYLMTLATNEEIDEVRSFYCDEYSQMRDDPDYDYGKWLRRFGYNTNKMETHFERDRQKKEEWIKGQGDILMKTFRLVAGAIGDIFSKDKEVQENARLEVTKHFMEDDVWMSDPIARIVQKIYGVKVLVVVNYPFGHDYYEDYEKTWPYQELVPDLDSEELYDRYVIINNIEGTFFETFISRITGKGIFTWDEFCSSPTLRFVFGDYIKSRNERLKKGKKGKTILL